MMSDDIQLERLLTRNAEIAPPDQLHESREQVPADRIQIKGTPRAHEGSAAGTHMASNLEDERWRHDKVHDARGVSGVRAEQIAEETLHRAMRSQVRLFHKSGISRDCSQVKCA